MPVNPVPGAGVDLNSHVYWDLQKADGTWFPLHTYAWSVRSFGGKRFFTGAKRGEDVSVPFRVGRIYTPKSREAQNYDIGMWVFPLNQDGTRDATKTVEQKAHENFRKIVNAVDQQGQFYLRKRWYGESSNTEGFDSGAGVQSAVAKAEFIDGSGPDADDGSGYSMNMTFSLADPYFYGNQLVGGFTYANKAATAQALTANATTNITKTGEAPTTHIFIEITLGTYSSAAQNPVITFPNGNWIEFQAYGLGLDSGTKIVIDCTKGVAVRSGLSNYFNPAGVYSVYLNGRVRRNPSYTAWPILDPSTTTGSTFPIAARGAGTISVCYDPAYR